MPKVKPKHTIWLCYLVNLIHPYCTPIHIIINAHWALVLLSNVVRGRSNGKINLKSMLDQFLKKLC